METLNQDQLEKMIAAWNVIDPEVAVHYEARLNALLDDYIKYDPEQAGDDDDCL